jgi:Na+/proline symporter/signal transduction histidine kinase/CheY-like chemotaxis protein
MIAGWLLFLVAAGYLVILFSTAAWADRRSDLRKRPRLRAWIYSLALGVYCTTWTVYGAVGSAVNGGWAYLPIYLGPILVFLFGFGLLERLVLVVRQQNAGSLSHLIAARFARSRPLAALITVIALTAAVPYVALQFKGIAASIEVLAPSANQGPGLLTDTALPVAIAMAVFAILFGTREASATAQRPGLLLAIALESVVKLVALVAVALLALDLGGSAWPETLARVSADPRWSAERLGTLDFLSQVLLAACAIVCLPRQFHITAVECTDPADLRLARRVFTGYLVLISLCVLPVAWIGSQIVPGGHPDHLVLRLPMEQGHSLIAVLAFLGGLSAGTAMVIVVSVALGTMVSNDLLMPTLMRIGALKLDQRADLSRWVLATRRFAIALLALLAFTFHRAAPEGDGLAHFGLLAFSAVAQFAPALLATLYWRNASERGVIAGLAGGFAVWVYTLLLPELANADWLPRTWVEQGPFGIAPLAPQALLGVAVGEPMTHGTLWSLAINIALLVWVSLRVRAPLGERLQAAPFLDPYAFRSSATDEIVPQVRQGELLDLAQRIIGRDQARGAFADYCSAQERTLAPAEPADRRLLQFTERLLAGAVGAGSARVMLTSALRGSGLELGEVVSALDETNQALRFNRELLQTTFEHMAQGVSVVDAEMRIVTWNRRYAELFRYPDGLLQVGRPVAELIRYNAESGRLGPGTPEEHIARRLAWMRAGNPHRHVREGVDGRVLEMQGEPLPGGGFLMSFNDVTELKRKERELLEAKEHLEERVEQRTFELKQALAAQEEARRAAHAAKETRTRFIAAASHDLLQPLSAARLFLSSLRDGESLGAGAGELVERVDSSLSAAEELLDGLIDLARLDAGVLTPEPAPFALSELFESLARQFGPIARSRGLALQVVSTRLAVHTDRKLLRRIVQNFVSNALRYTRSGGVVIGARRNGGKVRIEVWDSGPGIAPEVASKLFRDFERGSGASPWGERGLGLGLAGCLRLARLMGHALDFRSWPGRGTVFHVEAERVAAAATAAGDPVAQPVAALAATALRVLVVDNEPEVLEATRALLVRWGHAAQVAANGAEAAALLEVGSHDLALVDHQLDDGESGLDLIADWRTRGICPARVVMVSADRAESFLAAAKAMGVPVMHKPVKPAALRALLSSVTA